MSDDDDAQETTTPVADAIQAAEALEAAAAAREQGELLAMNEYHYVGHGPQPGERSSITVVDANGVATTVKGGGNAIALTDAQHAFLQREGHVFEEDIVRTPGG